MIFPILPFVEPQFTIEELIENLEMEELEENKAQSPGPKESSRYSLSQQHKPSDSSYIINESETDKDRESALKKSVSWNMESKENT